MCMNKCKFFLPLALSNKNFNYEIKLKGFAFTFSTFDKRVFFSVSNFNYNNLSLKYFKFPSVLLTKYFLLKKKFRYCICKSSISPSSCNIYF